MSKQHRKARSRGFTLIELIIFIVVVSAGLAGILSVINTVVKSSADPMMRKQTIAIAESLLEEILLKDYCDPDTVDTSTSPPTCGANTVESGRNNYDDVDDYNGYNTSSGIVDMLGVATPGLTQYNISPAVTVVASTDLAGVAAKKITVSVTGPQGTISLTGYRANY
jgi:MSHA pilin protein MshD